MYRFASRSDAKKLLEAWRLYITSVSLSFCWYPICVAPQQLPEQPAGCFVPTTTRACRPPQAQFGSTDGAPNPTISELRGPLSRNSYRQGILQLYSMTPAIVSFLLLILFSN